jgi:uncharacterized protein (TIGR00255 family)
MTGFGKSTNELNNKRVVIEIRTLNSKNLDINFRMPSTFKPNELNWRKMIAKYLRRGKVDVMINLQKNNSHSSVDINRELVKSYVEKLQDILPLRDGIDNAKLLEIAMSLPDVLKSIEEESTEDENRQIEEGINAAINQVLEFRKQEGNHLLQEFEANVNQISKNLNTIQEIDEQRIDKLKIRLKAAVSELKTDYDENRFEQELVYYIEKYDISEEKSRLKSHINYFSETLKSRESNGKKLNFISQEMGREINTIGSKANYAEMQNLVVDMKDQLEKIKEQLLNIL